MLKTVLARVLQYEVTPCPFRRGFTVELPEAPVTPIQKRPWRPKPRLEATPENATEDIDYFAASPANGGTRQGLPPSQANEIDNADVMTRQYSADQERLSTPELDFSSTRSSEKECESEGTDDTGFTHQDTLDDAYEDIDEFRTPTRPKPLRNGRAVTAPPHLTLQTMPATERTTEALPIPELKKESSSVASSVDSFHSFHSPISPLPPSPSFFGPPSPPPKSENAIDVIRTRGHSRDASELTITDNAPELLETPSVRSSDDTTCHTPPDLPATPTLTSDAASQDEDHWPEAITPSPSAEIRRRTVRSKRRSHSPLPSSANLYSPYSPRSHMSGHHFTNAILQRTCSILLGPPVQLVALMLRIAAKIAKGAFKGNSFGFGEGGQRIPCSWDFSSDGSDENDETWEEIDDYGFSLSRTASVKEAKAREMGESWEID
ncbi:hypothetical protein P7C71_g2494, partial [Lecanoromycetidae sp. Uapishka_2]